MKPQFKGYRLIEGYPEFDYAYGAIQIREKVVNGAEPGTVLRQFNLLGVTDGIVMDLTNEGVAMISADAGRLADGKLTLTREEAASFTLNISQP